jgi:hypothetical protein|tara:strand:+ start:68 stop:331 length:264 start_codon:yes stop_codon:yes gene_type:complete
MAHYSKTKTRKSLKAAADKEFDRLNSARGDNSKKWGTDKMRNNHWKMWKKRHDEEVDKKFASKKKKKKPTADNETSVDRKLYGDMLD